MAVIPLLSSLTKEECLELSKGIVKTKVRKGEKVFERGQTANKLYIICSGKVKVFNHTIDGKEQIVYILTDGDFIGAFNLLKEDTFVFDAIALDETQVCTIEKKQFDQILISNSEITLKILEKAYERIRKAESLVERLSTNSLDAKVAGLLLNLVDAFGTKTKEGILLNLTINREEMGSYAGIARESISRKLNLFQELGYIELQGNKKILIKEIKTLMDMK
jgi:CRP/FNR family transcriptional regulator